MWYRSLKATWRLCRRANQTHDDAQADVCGDIDAFMGIDLRGHQVFFVLRGEREGMAIAREMARGHESRVLEMIFRVA